MIETQANATTQLVPASSVPPPGYPLELVARTPAVMEALVGLGVRDAPDLARVTADDFTSFPGVGPGKLASLRRILLVASELGWPRPGTPPRTSAGPAYDGSTPLIDLVASSLRFLPPKEAAILGARFRVTEPWTSFTVLGDRYGFSNRRAQKIYETAYARLGTLTGCWSAVGAAISALPADEPVRMGDLTAQAWSAGLPYDMVAALAISEGGLHLVDAKGAGEMFLPFGGNDLARLLAAVRADAAGAVTRGDVAGIVEGAAGLLGPARTDLCRRVLTLAFGGCDGVGLMMALGLERQALAAMIPAKGAATVAKVSARLAEAMPDPPSAMVVRRLLNRHAVPSGKGRWRAGTPAPDGGRGAHWTDESISGVEAMLAAGARFDEILAAQGGSVSRSALRSKINRLGYVWGTRRVNEARR